MSGREHRLLASEEDLPVFNSDQVELCDGSNTDESIVMFTCV